MKKLALLLIALALLLPACAKNQIMLNPGHLPTGVVDKADRLDKWSFYVRNAIDARPEAAQNPALMGLVDQRFSDENLKVEMTPPPAEYIKTELSRFLFQRGMEASSADRARVFLDVTLQKFELTRDSTGVSDKSVLDTEYKVDFFTPAGEFIGSVSLPDRRWIDVVSPFSGGEEYQKLTFDMLDATFKMLAKTKIYLEAALR